jgi:ribonuclease HI
LDGAAKGNLGKGGYGVVWREKKGRPTAKSFTKVLG